MKKFDLFREVPQRKIPRNLFDLSHDVKMSGKFGYLYPVLLVDTLPGETWREQMVAFLRMAPMLAPVMHKIMVKTDFFFVPNRLSIGQELWENYITGGMAGTLTPVLQYFTPADVPNEDDMRKGSLWDYFGLPLCPDPAPAVLSTQHIAAYPFYAYTKIWNDYFRDPNLEDEIVIPLNEEGDQSGNIGDFLVLQKRGWERDPFTGALPWAQRGAEVLIPLSGQASANDITYKTYAELYDSTGANLPLGTNAVTIDALAVPPVGKTVFENSAGAGAGIRNIDAITFDNANTTITDFATSLAMQRWLENNARGGGRYIEQMQSHYGERVPDYRLQRAEYLGGGRQMVRISEVLSTTDTATVPVGDMAGHGVSVGKSNQFTYRCQEHGLIIGILSIVPVPSYASQGIEKLWTKDSRYDVGFPEFANLGEQPVLTKELLFSFDNADAATNELLFGYVPRYTEYKAKLDRIAGDFRDTLSFWHLARIFDAVPALDATFVRVEENGGIYEESYRRIFAVQDGTDYIWMQLVHNLTAKRPLPYFGVPKLIG